METQTITTGGLELIFCAFVAFVLVKIIDTAFHWAIKLFMFIVIILGLIGWFWYRGLL